MCQGIGYGNSQQVASTPLRVTPDVFTYRHGNMEETYTKGHIGAVPMDLTHTTLHHSSGT